MTMKSENGKGSKPRPLSDRAQFESNFEGIFGKRERPRPVFEPLEDEPNAGKADS
jgi:hypothetical protein